MNDQIETVQAFAAGYAICPLESAITNTASAAVDAAGVTLLVLQDHLKALCDLQLRSLEGEVMVATFGPGVE